MCMCISFIGGGRYVVKGQNERLYTLHEENLNKINVKKEAKKTQKKKGSEKHQKK